MAEQSLSPTPKDKNLAPQDKTRLARMWAGIKSDFNFCLLAVRNGFKEGGWYELMTLARKLNRVFEVLTATGIVAGLLFLYAWFVYPHVGKRWTAIVFLLLVTLCLLVTIRFIRNFHERRVGELNTELDLQIRNNDRNTAIFEANNSEAWDLASTIRNEKERIESERDALAAKTVRLKNDHEAELSNLKTQFSTRWQAQESRYANITMKLEGQINTLTEEKERLQAELEERDRHRLIFVVDDMKHQSQSQAFLFHFSEGEPALDRPLDHYSVRVNLRFRFENSDVNKRVMRSIEFSLMRLNQDGEASKVSPMRSRIFIMAEENATQITWPQGLAVEAITPYYWGRWEFDVVGTNFDAITNDGKRFDRDCFLRCTMDAMNQPPYVRDFDVDWEAAENGGTYDITPRR